ncbi:MAG: SelL-related redox protein [Saprospiraceae bacterium]
MPETPRPAQQQAPEFWSDMIAQNSGKSVAQLADETPVLLVFLRHFGCSFCREAMADIAKRRGRLEKKGLRIVFVHMAPEPKEAEKFFKKYKLHPIEHVSDPEKRFYRAFGLDRGTPGQLFGLMNWIRGFQGGVIEGHGFAYQNENLGDGFQMPGVFVLHKGAVIHSFVHAHAWDRPDYEAIAGQYMDSLPDS